MKTTNLTSIFEGAVPPVLFLDFDGTLSKRDVIDAILEKFADEKWLEIEKEWVEGRIGSRECLRRQFDLLRVTPFVLDGYLSGFELDRGVASLLDFCGHARIPVHIVSDGFEYYIRRMLKKGIADPEKVRNIGIWANQLTPVGKDRWTTEFPHTPQVCGDGCATCKPSVIASENLFASPSIFVGDGLSDRFAAQAADIVFAKHKLADFCRTNEIAHERYEDLGQVADSLRRAYESVSIPANWGLPQLELIPA